MDPKTYAKNSTPPPSTKSLPNGLVLRAKELEVGIPTSVLLAVVSLVSALITAAIGLLRVH